MSKKTLLLVEDEVFIRELYERSLKKAGFNVLTANDGLEGLSQAQKKPDIILLDIMLPELNGVEVLRKLKSDPNLKDIPVVMLTNLGQGSVIEESFNLGVRGYLVKMRVTPRELVEKIKQFISDPDYKMRIEELEFD